MRDDVLFVTADGEYPTLARLASYFFRELQAFGVVTSSGDMTDELAETYISARSGFTRSFLQTLETACTLRFAANANIPFCYNTGEWNKEGPVAGYTGPGLAVLPSEVAVSLTLNGTLRAKNALQDRLIKSALWYLNKTSLKDAIGYLFDLHQAGFTGDNELFDAAAVLLSGRSRAGSDEELLTRTLGRPAAEVTDWFGLVPQLDWLGSPSLDADGKAVLSSLFQRASQQIGRVRDAEDLDEWVLGQAALGGLLEAVRRLTGLFIDKPPLPWRAQLSQWEEIEADIGGMLRASRAGFNMLSAQTRTGTARLIGLMFRNQVGDGWQERFYQERLLVPAQLRQQFLFGEDLPMPTEWERLSWRVIYPWTIGIQKRELPGGTRAEPPSADEFMDLTAVHEVMEAAGISEPAEQRQALVRYLSGNDDELITALREALPSDENELHRELLRAEFGVLIQLSDAGRYAEAAERARLAVARYPYFAPAYLELAIALDGRGSPELAVEPLMAAIMLASRDPGPWQSLGVVLNRLGNRREANFASALREVLESERQQLSRFNRRIQQPSRSASGSAAQSAAQISRVDVHPEGTIDGERP